MTKSHSVNQSRLNQSAYCQYTVPFLNVTQEKKPFYHRASHINDATVFEAFGWLNKCSNSQSSCWCIQNDLHLIKLPYNYSGGRIAWSHFSFKHWLHFFIYFGSCSKTNTLNVLFFLDWTRFHFSKFNIKEQ